jgi:AraC-like DNA-binding protein
MTLLIDTQAVPAEARAEYWAQGSRDAFHPLQIRTEPGHPFSARMWRDHLGSIGFFRIAAAPNTMSRTPSDIAAGDPGCIHLEILLRGQLQGAQQQRAAALNPGDMTAYDTSMPTIFRAERPFEILVLRLAKAMLGKQAASISRLTSVRIEGGAGLPRLAGRFFFEAATGLADGSITHDDAGLEGHIIDLVRRLYVDLGSTSHPTRPRSMAELLLQAQAQIESRLGDPTLNPEQIASACFISTRYLHRVFESEGLSVCEFIRSARLDRCRRDLLDPTRADEPIQDIASRWGLPSAPHFSRLFRAAYGCSPREFRRAAGHEAPRDRPPERTTPFKPTSRALEHADAWARAGWGPIAAGASR